MRLTLVHPCIGRRRGEPYIRTWQMEPLAPAMLAGLTPRDVTPRSASTTTALEAIPFDEPTDLVAHERRDLHREARVPDRVRVPPARRAGGDGRLPPDARARRGQRVRRVDRRRRGGRACGRRCIEDFRAGRARSGSTAQPARPSLHGAAARIAPSSPGKRYLPVGLVEAGRGCHFRCEFCAVQSYFGSTQTRRPADEILEEIRRRSAASR